MTAIVVFAHGSSVEQANDGVRAMTAQVAVRGGFDLVETAFLECAQPDLPVAVARVVSSGATRVIVVPFFLTLGIHLRRDLPAIVDSLRELHPGVVIEVTQPLEGHPVLVDVMLGRAQDAMQGGVVGSQAH